MAAAAAAGLNRNGIRRTAFSTGDLQALSVMPAKSSPSPPDPAHASLHRYDVIKVKANCKHTSAAYDLSATALWHGLRHHEATLIS